jgi:hypothetical protein
MGQKRDIYDLTGVDTVKVVTQHVDKKGRLKGNSKKETKALRSICPHHMLNKKGNKVKAKIDVHGKECQCQICKEKFANQFYDDQAYDKAYNPIKMVASQAKMMAAATNADKKTVQEVAEFNLRLDGFGKVYKNLRKVAEKEESVKKKKGNKKDKVKSSAYASWQVNR